KHVQQIPVGKGQNVGQVQAFVEIFRQFVDDFQFLDQLVGLFVQAGDLESGSGVFGQNAQIGQIFGGRPPVFRIRKTEMDDAVDALLPFQRSGGFRHVRFAG